MRDDDDVRDNDLDDDEFDEIDEDERRIMEVFGSDEVPEVNEESLLLYRQYLIDRFDKTCVLTGREDFPWEETYIFGGGNKKEYERLKKTKPSYRDQYQLIDISEREIAENDLIADVKRLSDGKHFQIGLSWLTSKAKKGKDYQLLDDFATWVANWY